MTEFDELYRDLKCELTALRELVPGLLDHPAYLNLFDEFIREYEFGSALETACDYLLEPGVPAADDRVFDKIAALHKLMNVTDDCVRRLREKSGKGKGDSLN